MLRTKYAAVAIAFLCLRSYSLVAQSGGVKQQQASRVVVTAGGYQLTEEMIQLGLRFGQILAGADFSPSDAASLRNDMIAYFRKEPAKQAETYETVAKVLPRPSAITGKTTWIALANFRYKVWQVYAADAQAFREFQSYPFGRMVLKYNPVLINSGGMIVTQTDADCQFYSNAMVAQAAGMPVPGPAERQQFTRSLPSRFSSLPKDQQEYLTRAEIRLQDFYTVYAGTIRTRAVVAGDIRKNVHSAADVSREARQVENDAGYTGRYWSLYRNEAVSAIMHAGRTNADIVALGGLNDRLSQIMRTR